MDRAIRFLHSADLHLERPPGGWAEVPEHLRGALADAPYRAAARVFEAALKHQVDFVVLAGDVVDPLAAPPRAVVFLDEQFRRLADHGIRVYWAGGRADRIERMIDAWPLADHVHRFPLGRVQRVAHVRGGDVVAQILGTSVHERGSIAAHEFSAEPHGPFAVAAAYGVAEAAAFERQGINYWALGGKHTRDTLLTGPVTAHYCGTPQGRRPKESGPRGCTLVQVDEARRVRTVFVPTDAVRYCDERVTVDEGTSGAQLLHVLNERIGELVVDPFGPELFVRWTVSGSRQLAARLRSGHLADELVNQLRDAHGAKRPAVWTVAVQAAPRQPLAEEWYSEQTLLGEFLRAARSRAGRAQEPLDLRAFLGERHRGGPLAGLAEISDPAARRRVLAAAAALGAELLSPREDAP